MTASRPNGRHIGIDAVRYLLCFLVALLHSLPGTAGHTTTLWTTLIASVCRVAVPFFFVASGYFVRVPTVWTAQIVTRPLVRLLPVYVAWFLIYAGVDALIDVRIGELTVKSLLTGGTAFHLWFIPVLGITLAAVPTGITLIGIRATALGVVGLAAFGLIFGAYHEVLHLRDFGGIRLTMAPALVLIGHLLARHNIGSAIQRSGIRRLVAMMAVVLLLVVIEEALIARLSGSVFTSHDVVVMTYPLGATMFVLALSLNGVTILAPLARLGTISLGIYAAHLAFVRMFDPWIGRDTPSRAIALAIAATLAATLLSLGLNRLPLGRRLAQ